MTYILYDYYWPAFRAGGPIQSIKNLVALVERDINVSVVCGVTDVGQTPLPVQPDEFVDTANGRVLYSTGFFAYRRKLTDAGCYFINGLYSPQFNLLPILLLPGRKIISVRGMLTRGALNQRRWKKKAYITLLKLLKVHRYAEFHATNEDEAMDIKRVFGNDVKRVWVIPNIPKPVAVSPAPMKAGGQMVLATVALISPMKNILTVLRALQSAEGHIQYDIYGAVKDEGYLKDCMALIRQLPANVSVTFHGEVEPEQVDAKISAAHLYIQASVSENFGHSIFEALSLGRPVITSTTTPWQQLQNSNAGINVHHSDAAAIASAISQYCSMTNEEYQQQCLSARAYALRALNLQELKSRYLEMFQN